MKKSFAKILLFIFILFSDIEYVYAIEPQISPYTLPASIVCESFKYGMYMVSACGESFQKNNPITKTAFFELALKLESERDSVAFSRLSQQELEYITYLMAHLPAYTVSSAKGRELFLAKRNLTHVEVLQAVSVMITEYSHP